MSTAGTMRITLSEWTPDVFEVMSCSTSWAGAFEQVFLQGSQQLPSLYKFHGYTSDHNSASWRFISSTRWREANLGESEYHLVFGSDQRQRTITQDVVQSIRVHIGHVSHGVLLVGLISRFRRAFRAFVNEWRA